MMHKKIDQTFDKKILALDPNDPTCEATKYSIKIERAENLNTLEKINNHKKKQSKAKIF